MNYGEKPRPLLSTTEAAARLCITAPTVHEICKAYPGFAIRIGKGFKIPTENVERVLAGEPLAEISRERMARLAKEREQRAKSLA